MRLVRQALTESILLSLLGGAAGLAIAFAGTSLILHSRSPSKRHDRRTDPCIAFDRSAALRLWRFIADGNCFWHRSRMDSHTRRSDGSASGDRPLHCARRVVPRKTLVVLQAALSLVLLSASGLLTAVLHRLENQDFGFDQDRRIVASMNPMLAGYQPDQLTPLYRRIHDSLSSIPGVSAVALCKYSPLSGKNWGSEIWIDGQPPPGPMDDNRAFLNRVTAGYFDVIGNPIIRGRGITEQDTANSRHVAVINEALARKFFKNQDPIGKHFGRDGLEAGQYEIVGVAKDARYLVETFGKRAAPFFFLPEAQHDFMPKAGSPEIGAGSHFLHDIVIVTKPGASLSDAQMRRAVAFVDPNLPLTSIHTLKQQVAAVFTQQRLIARLTSFFGVLSLVLSCIGLYGITAYSAGCRVTEIGVRMALGANRGNVVSLVLRSAFALIGLGLIIGLPLTVAAGKLLVTQLYGMNPYNPVVMLIAVLALGLSALVASLIPAIRASWISPLEALRAE